MRPLLPCKCSDTSFPADGGGSSRKVVTSGKLFNIIIQLNAQDIAHNYRYLDVFGDVDFTGPQVAEARLFDQLTLVIGIGDPQGHAATTAL